MKRTIRAAILVFIVLVISACAKDAVPTDVLITPSPQVLEPTSTPTEDNEATAFFSSEPLGICFSYPQGYTQLPYNDAVEIVAPELSGTDLRGIFWLEISDADDRSAAVIADQDLTSAGVNADRSTVMVGGEEAVVLDGMPGQDLQRRVYVVHQGTLYVLAFMPTRSQNQAANDQVEELYAAILDSWAWEPCPTNE